MSAVGAAIAVCLIAGSCASSNEFGEVSGKSGEFGDSIETSTTLATDGRLPGSRSTSRGSSSLDGLTTEELLARLAEDPELLAQLDSLTPEQLSELTGLSTEELDTLGITPASVAALGATLVSGNTLGALTGGNADPAVSALVGGISQELSGDAGNLLAGIDPAVLAGILGSAITVDGSLTNSLGALLAVIDPNGLGRLNGDQSSLAVLAVVLSAAIGGDPVALGNLANLDGIDPQFRSVLGGIAGLVNSLTPRLINEINSITGILGPNTIAAIGAALNMLRQPAVGDVVRAAVADPLVMASSIGAALLLIPGLAEVVAPNTFSSPESRITALGALFVVSLVRMRTPGVLEFLAALGITVPPEILEQL